MRIKIRGRRKTRRWWKTRIEKEEKGEEEEKACLYWEGGQK